MKLNKYVIVLALAILMTMSGCGGSGGDWLLSEVCELNGLWHGSKGTTETASAIILKNGDTWIVSQNSTTNAITGFTHMHTRTHDGTFDSSGTNYLLDTGTTETASASGPYTSRTSMSGTLLSGANSSAINFAYSTKYEIPAQLADTVGTWTGTFGGGSSSRTLTIDADGKLTGTSTTGCNYSDGYIAPRVVDPAIFNVSFTETCVGETARQFSGVATLNDAKTVVSMAVVTADESKAALFAGTKQ